MHGTTNPKHILCSIFLNCAVYEIMWEIVIKLDRPQMTIWCLRIVRWVPKAKNTNSGYVILIAFPLQNYLYESA